MNDQPETLGSRLRLVRGPMSQTEFATLLGTHKMTVGKYERGEVVPGGEVLARLREACGTDINWLLTGVASEAAPPQINEAALADCITALEIYLKETRRSHVSPAAKAKAASALYAYLTETEQQEGEGIDPRVIDVAIRAAS